MPIAPAAYPPPFAASEVIAAPEAPADEQLEVGVAFVGGGPAGLACAIRLAQLLARTPRRRAARRDADRARRQGPRGRRAPAVGRRRAARAAARAVPGRVAGGHDELRAGRARGRLPAHGPARGAPAHVPPPMHNKGNHVFSLARLARFMAERAEELGVMVLPETDAQRLLVAGGAVRGIRTGDKGRGRQGEEPPTFEPGAELTRTGDGARRRVQGMLCRGAREHFAPAPENPQIYALGVKEVWQVAAPARPRDPHDRLAAQVAGTLPRVRRHLRLPDGPRHALPSASSSGSTTQTHRSRCTTSCRSPRPTR